MSLVASSLGNGLHEIKEADLFTRILTNQFEDNEEVRYDMPDTQVNTWAYIGVAKAGSSILDPVWACMRRMEC